MVDMRVGLIARADDRGLGMMTWRMAQHLDFDRVLVIDPPRLDDFPQHFDRFEQYDHLVARFDGRRINNHDQLRRWLRGLDVLYTAETFYDPYLPQMARELGIRTVCHVMPELCPSEGHGGDVTWLPTRWHADRFPGATIVPVPVDIDPTTRPPQTHKFTILHVAGKPALADRNGTKTVAAMSRLLDPADVRLIVTAQAQPPGLNLWQIFPRWVEIDIDCADTDEVFQEADLLVLPRRYGGLCLPALEAAARGIPIVMPLIPPNDEYPAVYCSTSGSTPSRMKGGIFDVYDVDERKLLEAVTHARLNWSNVQAQVNEWALDNTWDVLHRVYVEAFEAAMDREPVR
jgi:hypothetical protein